MPAQIKTLKQIYTRVEPAVFERLELIAKSQERSMAWVLRQIVLDYIDAIDDH